MKTLLIGSLLSLTFAAFGQTTVISIKSRQGDLAEIPSSTDKFGEFVPTPIYDTIIKIDDHCVIQIGTNGWQTVRFRDTICNHWYYEQNHYDLEKVQEYHGDNVVLIGFEDDHSELPPKYRPFRHKPNRLSIGWIMVLLGLAGLGTYIGYPGGRTEE